MSFDLVIRNGWIIDGMSPSIYRGAIGIKGDKVACIRPGGSDLPGERVIDATEYCVAPGFINVHSHADHFLLIDVDGSVKSKLMQGITTEIGGNCGSSAYPWNDAHRFYIPDMEERFAWDSFAGFLRAIEKKGVAVNFGSQVGLGSLRGEAEAAGSSTKNGSAAGQVGRLLEKALEEGAMGLSLGPGYHPDLGFRRKQLMELCEIVAKRGGVFSVHLYSEASQMLEALTDAVSMVVKTGASLQVSHFKTLDRVNWPRQDVALELIERVRSRGIDVGIDCFPYTFCCSPLGVFLPPHFPADKVRAGAHAMGSGDRETIERHLKAHFPEEESYAAVVCPHLGSPEFHDLENLDVLTMTAVLDRRPATVLVDLIAAEGPDRLVYYDCIGRDNMTAAIEMAGAMVASDPLPMATPSYLGNNVVHPRTFSAFQEYLREFVYRRHILLLPDAIKKITSAPAKKFGLKGRGVLGEGGFADIAIFDPENIRSGASVAHPEGPPSGMEYVIVNGRVAFERGEFQEVYAGKVLRRCV